MKIIVCVSDDLGTAFNKRRQSQDEKLRERIIELIGESRIFMNSYSGKMFESEKTEQIVVNEDFLDKAGTDDYCFVENVILDAYFGKIDEVMLCKWNRAYPSDTWFKLDLSRFKLLSTEDIEGKSHEKITIERWVR